MILVYFVSDTTSFWPYEAQKKHVGRCKRGVHETFVENRGRKKSHGEADRSLRASYHKGKLPSDVLHIVQCPVRNGEVDRDRVEHDM